MDDSEGLALFSMCIMTLNMIFIIYFLIDYMKTNNIISFIIMAINIFGILVSIFIMIRQND